MILKGDSWELHRRLLFQGGVSLCVVGGEVWVVFLGDGLVELGRECGNDMGRLWVDY